MCLCAAAAAARLERWAELVHGDRGAIQHVSALRAAVGNTRLCVAAPYWASEVFRTVCKKAVLRLLGNSSGGKWATSRAPGPIDAGLAFAWLWLPRAWVALELQKIRPHASATCMDAQGSSRSPCSVLLAHLSYLLELPSARMRQMSRLREPQGSKSGGREGLVAAWLVHFRFLLLELLFIS